MAELLGRVAQSNLQPPAGEGGKAGQPVVVVNAPTAEEVVAVHEQLNAEEQLVLQGKLDEMRVKREQELKKGKPKKVEQVNVGELKFVVEEKKAGLPERIKKLPKDHPVRILYEKGFKQKAQEERKRLRTKRRMMDPKALKELIVIVSILVLIVVLVGGVYKGNQSYQSDMDQTRQAILLKIKEKNYRPDHPTLKKEFTELFHSQWLPDLKKLLSFIDGLSINYAVFDGNPEPGSYTEYIKRHRKPFNQADAMEWYAREIRKPSWVTNQ